MGSQEEAVISAPGLYFRTALFIDGLSSATGLGYTRLHRLINDNQYARYGLKGVRVDTVQRYFRLTRSPAIDPRDGKTPPWLMAAEMEFPGCSDNFFHPIIDLLLGQEESTIKWRNRLQRIPEQWIAESENQGFSARAEEWRALNAGKFQAGRKPRWPVMDRLSYIHQTMMRLPNPFFTVLFRRPGLARMHTRTYSPIREEIAALSKSNDLNQLTALIGLVYEAAEIGDMARYDLSCDAARRSLSILDDVPECKRAAPDLKFYVEELCLKCLTRRYKHSFNYGFGLAATWRTQLKPPMIQREDARNAKILEVAQNLMHGSDNHSDS